jgi:hypothetical protein
MREDIVDEVRCDLDITVSSRNNLGSMRSAWIHTIGVDVVDATKVMFMSCSIRIFGASSRFRARPSRIELCSTR